jgi:hypothetical protein
MTPNNEALDQLETFLKRAKTNLGTKGPARDRFIANVMAQARAIAPTGPGGEVKPKPKKAPSRDPNRVMTFEPKNLNLGPGGSVQMTSSESMRADEELGHSPFAQGNNNGQ